MRGLPGDRGRISTIKLRAKTFSTLKALQKLKIISSFCRFKETRKQKDSTPPGFAMENHSKSLILPEG